LAGDGAFIVTTHRECYKKVCSCKKGISHNYKRQYSQLDCPRGGDFPLNMEVWWYIYNKK